MCKKHQPILVYDCGGTQQYCEKCGKQLTKWEQKEPKKHPKRRRMEAPKFSFAIIKHRGDLNHAETADGHRVHRQDKIWFPEHGWVKCAPYDNHFVYDDPMARKITGRWTPMCSCGSPSGIVGYKAYENDASPTTKKESVVPGELLVCLAHAQYGRHSDGSA